MANRESIQCEVTIIHQDVIDRVNQVMPSETELDQLHQFFKSYSDKTRLSILSALLTEEMCVCDLAALLGMSQSAVSHQLRLLREARLVKTRRDGKVVYYSLDDDHVNQIMTFAHEHIRHG